LGEENLVLRWSDITGVDGVGQALHTGAMQLKIYIIFFRT